MSRKSRPASPSTVADAWALRLFRREAASRVLGPHTRAVLWVQGCSLACSGCLVPRSWPRHGDSFPVAEVAAWLVSLPDIEGITFTGGEPMDQAAPLAHLVDLVRRDRDLGVVCYTGHCLDELRSTAQQALLDRADLLIDGRYRADLHGDFLWRASSNQRLLALTDRYRDLLPGSHREDRGAGLELVIEADGRFAFTGVPPWPDYVQGLPTAEVAS